MNTPLNGRNNDGRIDINNNNDSGDIDIDNDNDNGDIDINDDDGYDGEMEGLYSYHNLSRAQRFCSFLFKFCNSIAYI